MPTLLTGASGQLGSYLLRLFRQEAIPVTAWSGTRAGDLFGFPLHPVDLSDFAALSAAFRATRPRVVIHSAALARVADCYRDPHRARILNTEATALLASLCAQSGARLVHVSTDLVFDGERAPYLEMDAPAPVSVYGRTKADAEQSVLAYPGHVVVRLSLLFGPSLLGRPGFFDEQVAALRTGRAVTLFQDEWRTPLDLESAARGLLAIARSDCTGIVHLGGPERLSRLEMGRQLARVLGVEAKGILPASRHQAPAAEPRPRDVSLNSLSFRQRFPQVPIWTFQEALRRLLGDPRKSP